MENYVKREYFSGSFSVFFLAITLRKAYSSTESKEPFSYSTVAHVLLIADILISNSFNHYVNLDIMLSLGIPCVVAICAVHYCMQRLYAQHYKTEKELGRRGVCHAAVWAESCGGKSLCGGTAAAGGGDGYGSLSCDNFHRCDPV